MHTHLVQVQPIGEGNFCFMAKRTFCLFILRYFLVQKLLHEIPKGIAILDLLVFIGEVIE
jgi:hypothetical protein